VLLLAKIKKPMKMPENPYNRLVSVPLVEQKSDFNSLKIVTIPLEIV